MARRPYWSGQIRLALVFLPVNIYTATKRSSQIPLHEYERESGERIHHRDINESGEEVESDEIVKGYEKTKGRPIYLEKEELDAVKLPSSDTLELKHFVDQKTVPMMHFERPYYVLPDGESAQEIYAVLRDAMDSAGKIGIGQIALRGREELCALMPYGKGLMIETLRYGEELYEPKEFYDELKPIEPSPEYVKLAEELIKRSTGKLDLKQFHDHYHEAMRELIASKEENRAPEYHVAEAPGKVIDLMDALKQSLGGGKAKISSAKAATPKAVKPAAKKPAKKASKPAAKKPSVRKRA